MKIKLLICAIVGGAFLAFAANDPVLMTINGKDIHLSEFEYLYKKNQEQQVQKESVEQYLDRFVTFKRKVADAEANGIDTLKSFQAEYNGYKNDLAKPYFEDAALQEKLQREAYERMQENVDVDHIMLVPRNREETEAVLMQRMDSIRNCIVKNGEDFFEVAKKCSMDPSVQRNNGHYGYISSGQFPYAWEYVAYTTPTGEVSKPFRTDFGVHLIRANGHRPDPGQVEAEHILILTQNKSDDEKAAAKAKIDSLYNVVKAGADFEEIAKKYSEDRGSAKNGGKLGWFGINRMVPEFEKVAYALADGEISEPFATSYGYHIVKKLGHKGVGTYEESVGKIKAAMQQDERSQMSYNNKIEQLKKQYNYKNNDKKFRAYLEKELKKHGQYDSTFVTKIIGQSDFTIATYADVKVPAKVLAKLLNPKAKLDNPNAVGYIAGKVDGYIKGDIMQHYVDNISNDNAEYRNLINEYRDGMLLFEISNRKVWEGASKDTTGLQKQFEANRSKYSWDKPHFKGIILSANSDSTAQAVKAMIPTLGADTLTQTLHKQFGNKIKMERYTPVAKGENAVIDDVVFGVSQKEKDAKYPVAFVLEGGVINQPESYTDVKGQVTSDYQEILEKEWLESLEKKYPVKVNKNVLKMVK